MTAFYGASVKLVTDPTLLDAVSDTATQAFRSLNAQGMNVTADSLRITSYGLLLNSGSAVRRLSAIDLTSRGLAGNSSCVPQDPGTAGLALTFGLVVPPGVNATSVLLAIRARFPANAFASLRPAIAAAACVPVDAVQIELYPQQASLGPLAVAAPAPASSNSHVLIIVIACSIGGVGLLSAAVFYFRSSKNNLNTDGKKDEGKGTSEGAGGISPSDGSASLQDVHVRGAAAVSA